MSTTTPHTSPDASVRKGFLRRNRLVIVAAAAVAAIALAWLAFGYFEVQKAFIDDKVNEAAPAGGAAATATGTFVSRSHTTTGSASVLGTGDGATIRLGDLKTENGPDVRVYLSAGTAANGDESAFDDDFVDLGELKGNIGSQNYAIPAGTDIAKYKTVVLWCRRFSVAFGAADLTPA